MIVALLNPGDLNLFGYGAGIASPIWVRPILRLMSPPRSHAPRPAFSCPRAYCFHVRQSPAACSETRRLARRAKRLWLSARCDRRYCFAVLGASCFMNIYLSINVAIARKKYNVQVRMASRCVVDIRWRPGHMQTIPPHHPPPHAALCYSPRVHCSFTSAHARAAQYPALYAPPGHKNEFEFNSVQRAHQNTLESYGPVMVQMMACGLKYPVTAAVCGALYVLGRVIYGYGYGKGTQTRVDAPLPKDTCQMLACLRAQKRLPNCV